MEDKKSKKVRNVFAFFENVPKIAVVIPIIMYLALNYCTVRAARSEVIIMIAGNRLPVSSFAGVFSSIANISLILMVLIFRKTGLILSVVLLLFQMPSYFMGLAERHDFTMIPGLFLSLFTVIMLVVVYLYQLRMEKEKKRLRNLFVQTATALVTAIDAKDTYTHGHSSRVAEYAKKLAEQNHKSPAECEEVYYTALLHDVGKIGVPESIINKKGKLTPEEYDVIKTHSVRGSQILQSISEFPYLSIGALSHHERYDGQGYPFGMKGTDIPEIARIISVADAYDAMSSKRSYRDPLPQQHVREELVKGAGTQFDPEYARIMVHLIDIDTDYEMREREEIRELAGKNELVVGEYRSEISEGILLTPKMTTVHMTITASEDAPGKTHTPSLILFDSRDGRVHDSEKDIKNLNYFEYGEVWLDGHAAVSSARKIQTTITDEGDDDIVKLNEYKVEAVKIKDHVLIRIMGKNMTAEVIIALPDSTRYVYIGLTGEYCKIGDVRTEKADIDSPEDYIPRIAEEISYIKGKAGDIPNVQIDGYRTAASEGIEIKDGLKISFRARNLPTARLVWHCPFIDIFCSDDGKVNGENYQDLAFMRFDGEFWECDENCKAELNVRMTESFENWESWKKYNHDGFDAVVTFIVDENRITIITVNSGISIKSTLTVTNIERPIYAAITGDQVAITNIRITNDKDK